MLLPGASHLQDPLCHTAGNVLRAWFGSSGVQMTGLGKQASMQGGGKSAPSGNAGNAGPERPREQRGPVSLLSTMRL